MYTVCLEMEVHALACSVRVCAFDMAVKGDKLQFLLTHQLTINNKQIHITKINHHSFSGAGHNKSVTLHDNLSWRSSSRSPVWFRSFVWFTSSARAKKTPTSASAANTATPQQPPTPERKIRSRAGVSQSQRNYHLSRFGSSFPHNRA